MGDKIKKVEFGNHNALLAAAEMLKREMPALIEYAKALAVLRKASYEASINAGFTPEQALELCKSMTF